MTRETRHRASPAVDVEIDRRQVRKLREMRDQPTFGSCAMT
jgi:hypothetical protein